MKHDIDNWLHGLGSVPKTDYRAWTEIKCRNCLFHSAGFRLTHLLWPCGRVCHVVLLVNGGQSLKEIGIHCSVAICSWFPWLAKAKTWFCRVSLDETEHSILTVFIISVYLNKPIGVYWVGNRTLCSTFQKRMHSFSHSFTNFISCLLTQREPPGQLTN